MVWNQWKSRMDKGAGWKGRGELQGKNMMVTRKGLLERTLSGLRAIGEVFFWKEWSILLVSRCPGLVG